MANVLDLKHPQPAPEQPVEPVVAEPVVESVAEPVEDSEGLPPLELNMLADFEPIEWEARHTLNDRSLYRHYMAMSGFALVGGVVAWWQTSWFSFLTIAIGLAAWELHERFGKPVQVRLDERGVSVGQQHYPHAALSSFDLHQMADGTVELSLMTRHWHSPLLRLPLGDQDAYQVRTFLLGYVPEEPHPVPLVERLIRRE